MATSGLYGNSPNGTLIAQSGTETTGLFGKSPNGSVVAAPGSDTSGLYGNAVVTGGTYFEWFIFQESATQPATPTGGSWSFVTNTGTPPTGWSLIPPSNPTNQVWVSIALVNSRSTSTLTWSTPGLFGVVPNFTFPTPITGAAGSNAAVVNTGTATNPILTFTIPRGNTGATGATGPTGATGAQGVPGINWLGTWSSATTYAIRDAVTYNGTSYYAIAANTNQAPPNATYWNVLAQKGADGAGGVSSITGTANQITASASTGAVTLSLPSTINVNTSGNAATATSATSATTATTATNIANGAANQIPYQTGAGATSFVTAPTVDSTYLKYNTSGGFSWATVSGGGGSGTVTSVSLSAPSFLSVSGSPVTTSGTLALSYSGTALPIANGGTGDTTATGARTNLGLGTMSTQNANAVAITGGTESGVTHSGDTIGTYLDYTGTSAPSYVEGRSWYDTAAHALAYYNDSANAVVHIGQDLQVKVINNTGSTIANGSPVYITGTSSGQTYPNIALAKADVAATSAVIGLANGSIANGAIGYVTSQGGIDNVNTGTFTVGQVLYLSPYSAGQLMNTIPPTGITVQVGVVSFVNSSTGKIYVKQTTPLNVPASIISGVVAVANGGTGATTTTAAFNALSPITAVGDLIVGNGANSATRLGIGTNGYVLTSNGTTATWAAGGGGSSSGAGNAYGWFIS